MSTSSPAMLASRALSSARSGVPGAYVRFGSFCGGGTLRTPEKEECISLFYAVSNLDMSPAQRAVAIAAFVVTVALGLYAAAAAVDRWPELVIAACGEPETPSAAPPLVPAAARHQAIALGVALCAWQTAEHQHFAWAAATVALGLGWAWTLPPLVGAMERATTRICLHAYFRSFQIVGVLAAIALVYASVAMETLWLWRPAAPADLQAFVWLAILEFSGLPLTLIAVGARS
jgi:hypothetical protein